MLVAALNLGLLRMPLGNSFAAIPFILFYIYWCLSVHSLFSHMFVVVQSVASNQPHYKLQHYISNTNVIVIAIAIARANVNANANASARTSIINANFKIVINFALVVISLSLFPLFTLPIFRSPHSYSFTHSLWLSLVLRVIVIVVVVVVCLLVLCAPICLEVCILHCCLINCVAFVKFPAMGLPPQHIHTHTRQESAPKHFMEMQTKHFGKFTAQSKS